MRVHVNFGKSVFEHSCGGGVGRARRVKSSVLTAFADAPMRSIVGSTDSSKSVLNAVEKSGLDMSLRQAQEYVRASTSTSWEQFVFELGCLEGFFEQCRIGDTEGEYQYVLGRSASQLESRVLPILVILNWHAVKAPRTPHGGVLCTVPID